MEEEKKYLKVGKRWRTKDHYCYQCGYVREWDIVGDGLMGCVAYKDEEVFLKEPDEICYMTEVCFHNSFETELQRWIIVAVMPPREKSLYTTPWAWTANELKKECEKFLKRNPKFDFDLDEFTHFFFLKSAALIDLSNDIDPLTSSVSLLEAALELKKQKDEKTAVLTQTTQQS